MEFLKKFDLLRKGRSLRMQGASLMKFYLVLLTLCIRGQFFLFVQQFIQQNFVGKENILIPWLYSLISLSHKSQKCFVDMVIEGQKKMAVNKVIKTFKSCKEDDKDQKQSNFLNQRLVFKAPLTRKTRVKKTSINGGYRDGKTQM